jgi:hypothetical protein
LRSQARDRALSILHPDLPLESGEFAHYMWPLSPSWQRTNSGRAIRSKAVGFLTCLREEGLVESRTGEQGVAGYVVTPGGMRLASGW